MKIVIVSQHLFPMPTPRAHRTTELLIELSKMGHDVTLYAVLGKHDYSSFEQQYNVKVKGIKLKFMFHPYNSDNDKKRAFIDKVLGKLLGKFEFPNIEFLYRISDILKKDHDYDAIITIADPHQIHWGTARYKLKNPNQFPKVWIADCGDPFMLNGASDGHFSFFSKYEKEFCSECDYITVPVENAKTGYFPEFRDKINVISQGFDFSLNENNQFVPNSKITFGFAGNFYKDIRNPESFINYLASLKVDFQFVVYTPFPNLINQYKTILGERLIIRNAIQRLELIEELKKMDFLVNIENINSPAQIPSKLIDYAITGRPILSVNPSAPKTDIIDAFLKKDYTNQLIIEDIMQYHISNVAQKFIDLIEEKISKKPN